MGTPGGFNNFGRERVAREIGEEHQQKLLRQAEVGRIKHELRESREERDGQDAAKDTARARSFSALGVALRVIAIVVLLVILLALVVVLVRGV